MKIVHKALLVPILVVMSLGASLLTTNRALALSTPMTSACLGGTLVKSKAFSSGTLRIYKSCGMYYAQFGSNGVRRTFTLQVFNGNDWNYSSQRSFSNVYGGWTNLIPAGCVGAQYIAGGSTLAYITYGC